MKLSLVIPCFNEAPCIRPFYSAVTALSLPCELEFIFIDDGSTDNTLAELKSLSVTHTEVHFISFSRNFGKEAALLAGLRKSSGMYTVTLDADLQHPVSLLSEMLTYLTSGEFDCVAARRITREKGTRIRNCFARCFYFLLHKISKLETLQGETDYRMMTHQVVSSILTLPEVNRFTKGIYAWVGFKTKWLTFENVERVHGKTKWSFFKLLQYSIEGLSAFSTIPLQISSLLGVVCFSSAILYSIYVIFKTIIIGEVVQGYPTLVCLILFLGGVQLFTIGILGNYLAKTYLETKRRPMYLIKEEK